MAPPPDAGASAPAILAAAPRPDAAAFSSARTCLLAPVPLVLSVAISRALSRAACMKLAPGLMVERRRRMRFDVASAIEGTNAKHVTGPSTSVRPPSECARTPVDRLWTSTAPFAQPVTSLFCLRTTNMAVISLIERALPAAPTRGELLVAIAFAAFASQGDGLSTFVTFPRDASRNCSVEPLVRTANSVFGRAPPRLAALPPPSCSL